MVHHEGMPRAYRKSAEVIAAPPLDAPERADAVRETPSMPEQAGELHEAHVENPGASGERERQHAAGAIAREIARLRQHLLELPDTVAMRKPPVDQKKLDIKEDQPADSIPGLDDRYAA